MIWDCGFIRASMGFEIAASHRSTPGLISTVEGFYSLIGFAIRGKTPGPRMFSHTKRSGTIDLPQIDHSLLRREISMAWGTTTDS